MHFNTQSMYRRVPHSDSDTEFCNDNNAWLSTKLTKQQCTIDLGMMNINGKMPNNNNNGHTDKSFPQYMESVKIVNYSAHVFKLVMKQVMEN